MYLSVLVDQMSWLSDVSGKWIYKVGNEVHCSTGNYFPSNTVKSMRDCRKMDLSLERSSDWIA